MDGNGRWATERGLPRLMGHTEGYKTLRNVLLAANELGIKVLTVYAFSAENWRRPKEEVDGLMKLITQAAIEELRVMHQNNVRVRASGRLSELPTDLQEALTNGIETTKNNTGITFVLAINYGGRTEIIDAANAAFANGITTLTEELMNRFLYNPDIPEPDLLIRTAGEMRLSNFLLWQGAYSELLVTQKTWPEFSPEDLKAACEEYSKRTRKFGAVID